MKVLKICLKILKKFFLLLLIVFLFNWIGDLVMGEIMTNQCYDEFKDAYKQINMFGDMEYFRVLEYRPYRSEMAQVYYVGKGHSVGTVFTFRYNIEKRQWDVVSWSTVWSDSGSASEVIWPYWWHFIYGGI